MKACICGRVSPITRVFEFRRETTGLKTRIGTKSWRQALQQRCIGTVAKVIGKEQHVDPRHRLKADDSIETPVRRPLEVGRECRHAAVIGQGFRAAVQRDGRQIDIGQLAGRVQGNFVAATGELVGDTQRMIFQAAARQEPENADRDLHDVPGVLAAAAGG